MATGRSWLIWAFMPASANWIDSIPTAARRSTSGRQASGTAAGSPAMSAAAKYRLANSHVEFGHERGIGVKALSELAVHLAW